MSPSHAACTPRRKKKPPCSAASTLAISHGAAGAHYRASRRAFLPRRARTAHLPAAPRRTHTPHAPAPTPLSNLSGFWFTTPVRWGPGSCCRICCAAPPPAVTHPFPVAPHTHSGRQCMPALTYLPTHTHTLHLYTTHTHSDGGHTLHACHGFEPALHAHPGHRVGAGPRCSAVTWLFWLDANIRGLVLWGLLWSVLWQPSRSVLGPHTEHAVSIHPTVPLTNT